MANEYLISTLAGERCCKAFLYTYCTHDFTFKYGVISYLSMLLFVFVSSICVHNHIDYV